MAELWNCKHCGAMLAYKWPEMRDQVGFYTREGNLVYAAAPIAIFCKECGHLNQRFARWPVRDATPEERAAMTAALIPDAVEGPREITEP